MDALSTVLETIKLSGVVYRKIIVTAPWGMDVNKDHTSQFWRLIKGRCVIGLAKDDHIDLKEGDLVFIPHGSAHWISDSITSLRIPSIEFVRARQAGIPIFQDGDEEIVLMGGHFQFDEEQMHPFLKDLPQVIHISEFGMQNQLLLQHVAQLIVVELNEEKPGNKLMLKCLAEMVFINIIRAYLEQDTPENGFLSALNDTQISKALKLMQDSPERDWTLELLAGEVGMSRSVFFNRFKKMVNETPLNYLTNWRIRKAKELLLRDKSNISEVAMNLGYQSEAAFNRIFKIKMGKTPAMWRREKVS